MSKTPVHILQIQTLSKAYGAELIADLLGITTRAMQKWVQEPDTNPRKETLRSLAELFTRHEAGDNLALSAGTEDFTGKYINALEKERDRLQKDLDLSLGELRDNSLLSRAVAETVIRCGRCVF